jgi:TRAP transporter TAXI family solute receptor
MALEAEKEKENKMRRAFFAVSFAMFLSLSAITPGRAGEKSLAYADPYFISVFASAPGGAMYNMAAAIAPIWSERLNVMASIGPGGSYSNYLAVNRGDADMGFCHQSMHFSAERGESPFKEIIKGNSHLSTLFPAVIQIFTAVQNTSIKTMSDVGDKRIGLGPQGSASTIFAMDFLNRTYGITPESIMAAGGTVGYMSDSDVSSAIADGIIDIGFQLSAYPKATIQEIENTPGIRLIPFESGTLEKYLEINKGWNKGVIPAGTYAGQKDDIDTAASWATMTVSDKMDNELAYRLTKVMWDNIALAAEASAEIKMFMKLETATAAMAGAKLHPGAERYYREKGIIK